MTPGQQAWTADVLVQQEQLIMVTGLSTGLRYWLPYKSNCSLHPITMKSGRVEYWRTGSGGKYQQGQFLAELREELCLNPWFHQLLSPQLNWVLRDWTEPEVQVFVAP